MPVNHLDCQEPHLGIDIGYVFPWLNKSVRRRVWRDKINDILGFTKAHEMFLKGKAQPNPNTFLNVLKEMRMQLDYGDLLEKIPETGSVIVIANHPFGGADAIALSGLCIQKRLDVKVLANAMGARLPGMKQWTIPLQILGEDGATQSNRAAMKDALGHLRSGGVLVVFPAGAVSRWRNDLGRIADPPWSEHVARLALKTQTSVLPVKIFGHNPGWFELLGRIHPMVRSALIVRVCLSSRGQLIRCRASKLISVEKLEEREKNKSLTRYLREKVEEIRLN